jgi:hypothetical protein
MNLNTYAIYFPQFYSLPVNDEAWGKGFTDWLLVGQANFQHSWERRVPLRGFYNGSDPNVHKQQTQEALEAGLSGFAVYHYWFYSQRLLGAFEDGILAGNTLTGKDQWFIIWASENWSKRWVGSPELLIDLNREPTQEMMEAHCEHLLRCFSSPGYVKWHNRPLFVIYNLGYFKSPEKLVNDYRECLSRFGIDVAMAHVVKSPADLEHCAYMDASYLFEPRLFFNSIRKDRGSLASMAHSAFRNVFGGNLTDKALVLVDQWTSNANLFTKMQFSDYFKSEQRAGYIDRTGVNVQNILCPGWNNAPRYGKRFTMLEPATTDQFEQQLISSSNLSDLPVLINAWNEWSEGAAIEPCGYTGREYLDVVTRATKLNKET